MRVIGLMRALANELGPHRIRVNAVCPTNVNTPMIQNPANYRTFRPDLADPGREDIIDIAASMHMLDVPWVEPEDVTAAAVWLASDAARYLTGVALAGRRRATGEGAELTPPRDGATAPPHDGGQLTTGRAGPAAGLARSAG